MVEDGDELVDRVRAERVAHLGPVERHPDHRRAPGAVVRDVGQVEAGDRLPELGVERLVHALTVVRSGVGSSQPTARASC